MSKSKSKSDLKRFNIRLSELDANRLKRLASKTDRTFSILVRRAIEQFLQQNA